MFSFSFIYQVMNAAMRYPDSIIQVRGGWENVRKYIGERLKEESGVAPVRRVNGYYVYIDTTDSYVGKSIGVLGSIEFPVTALFKHVVRRGMTVIDAGAHIGWYTLLAARLVGPTGLVYSFEPEPTNLAYLSRSIKANNFKNIIVRPKALANLDGDVDFYVCPDNPGGHTIVRRHGLAHGFARTRVPCIRLDSFLEREARKSVDVFKLDVEGAEPIVLEGARNLLVEASELRVFMEYSPRFWVGYETVLHELWKLFEVYEIVWSPFLVRQVTLGKLKGLSPQTNLYLRRRD